MLTVASLRVLRTMRSTDSSEVIRVELVVGPHFVGVELIFADVVVRVELIFADVVVGLHTEQSVVELIFADVVVRVVLGQLVFKDFHAVNKAGDYPAQPCELLADVFAVRAHGARAAVKALLQG
jgi:hypothetical protein